MAKGLTKKQELFVSAYIVSLNATKAAIAAGYSEKRAAVAGAELVRNRKVSELIAKKTQKVCEKFDVSAEKVLQEISKLAFFDPRKLFNADGSPKGIHELDDETAAAVAGLDVSEIYNDKGPIGLLKKYKLADKGQNLERLGRYLKLFTDKMEHSGKVTLEDLISNND